MKLLLPLLLFFCSISYSQITIKKVVDKMDDSESYAASKNLKLIGNNKKWFIIRPMLDKNDSNKIVCKGLYISYSGIGNCNENDVMDFLFIDGTKLKINAFNGFRCKNSSAFIIDKDNTLGESLTDISILSKPIKSIRFMNGRTFDNLTVDLPEKDRKYFIELQAAIATQRTD